MDKNKNDKAPVTLEETNSPSEGGMSIFKRINVTSQAVNRRHLPQWALAWIVLVPALIFLIVFMIYPILNTFVISLFKNFKWLPGASSLSISNIIRAYQMSGEVDPVTGAIMAVKLPEFGIGNFIEAFQMKSFQYALFNTGLLVIVSVPLTIIIALLISGLLNSIKALRGVFQTIFFLPYVTNTLALGIVFNALFDSGSAGLVNTVFMTVSGWFGEPIDPIVWISETALHPLFESADGKDIVGWALTGGVITVYSIWNGLAFKILVFMGGLATIDKQYYDAAKVDGAKGGTIFRRITLPLLSPQILYIMITSFIGAFKAFTGVRAIFVGDIFYFGGQIGELWMTVVGWVYREMKLTQNTGVAAAGSMTLLIIILIITGIQFIVSKRRVHY